MKKVFITSILYLEAIVPHKSFVLVIGKFLHYLEF